MEIDRRCKVEIISTITKPLFYALKANLFVHFEGRVFATHWNSTQHPCLRGEVRDQKLLGLSFHSRYILKTDHDDVIKWKHFLRYWPFVRGIHRSPVNSSHKGQ